MCIRDRNQIDPADFAAVDASGEIRRVDLVQVANTITQAEDCLLYTSDAADERSSVDLGGRRILNKKNLRTI